MIAEAIACAARRLGPDGDAVLARIGGGVGANARAAATVLANLAPAAERFQRAQWLATARLPIPAGFRAIHASWIEAALVELPARARSAVANGGDAIDVWLARKALAEFVAMPSTEPASLAPDALRAWLERAGADELARAAQIAGGDVLERARVELAEAFERIARQPPPKHKRAVLARCAGIANDELRLVRLGARAVAPQLDDRVRRQVLQRLPRALGLAIRTDLSWSDNVDS